MMNETAFEGRKQYDAKRTRKKYGNTTTNKIRGIEEKRKKKKEKRKKKKEKRKKEKGKKEKKRKEEMIK